MKTNATLLISEETKKPYLILNDFFVDNDGESTVTIESEGVGLIQDDQTMDLPMTYYEITEKMINLILKNRGKCSINLDNQNRIKRIENKVIISFPG